MSFAPMCPRTLVSALAATLALALTAAPPGLCSPAEVPESARKIPVAYEVDVVVVGGGAGAVAAAEAAAKAGAKVFLAAPRTYLGEDVAGTLRVWSRPGWELTTALAKKLFGASAAEAGAPAAPVAGGLALKYEADRPSGPQHKDTNPPSLLADGKWQNPVDQSVQYDGPVTIVADLGEARDVATACLMVFHAKDFLVDAVEIATSPDKKAWKALPEVRNTADKGTESSAAVPFSAKVDAKARYVRFQVKPSAGAKRVLVGEILVAAPAGAAAPVAGGAKEKPEKPDEASVVLVRPLHVKRTLDEALLGAGVQYLHGCLASDVLRDAYDKPCGIVMANRNGRQAVIAKVVIDATDRAWVARMAGAKAKPIPAGLQTFKRVVVGGELRGGDGVSGRTLPETFGGRPVHEYTLKLDLRDGGYDAWAEAEQKARDLTYHPEQLAAADFLFQVPPDAVVSEKPAPEGTWPGAAAVDLGAFRPAGVERLYVLGGCADLPRAQAERLLEPPALIEIGARIGAAAAAEAKALAAPRDVKLAGKAGAGGAGDAKEMLEGVRQFQKAAATVDQPARGLPVLGRYDVVVVGGGTSGAPAAIAAARQGAKTLLVEYQCGLGGVGTLGMISSYYWGNKVGFTKEVPGGNSWKIEPKAEWWRSEARKAGAEIWFAAAGCGAYVEGGRVRGAIVATPQGRGVVLAKAVIDATGNADVAAAAGAATVTTGAEDVALQGVGLPPRELGKNYTNTDYSLVDDTDLVDMWRFFVEGRQMAKNAFDQGPLIDSRERRRIVGDFTITILDEVLDRTHPDTVLQAYSNFDTHGYTVEPYFTIHFPHKKGIATNVPYRAMLPKGLEGLLVVGLGMSVHRDALPVVRMQPDLQNGGYAAGVAAAMAAKAGAALRAVDLKALQRHLVEIGNLKESVLTDRDNFPLPAARVAEAVNNPTDEYKDTAVILANPKEALPHVKKAFAGAKDDAARLHLAQVLSILGDPAGLDVILAAVEAAPGLDKGWHYVGMGQFGSSMSPLDTWVYALGRIGDKKATPALVAKLRLLKAETEFSHFRALAWAFDRIGDPAAAPALAEALARPGVRGQAMPAIGAMLEGAKGMSWTSTGERAEGLRELFLARALFRCGDHEGLGRKVLEEYAKDLRGHFARHATAVLEKTK